MTIKIFVKGRKTVEKIVIPKGIHYQIINRKRGSIGQANNYPDIVTEVLEK